MANIWIPNGSSYITASNMGDLLDKEIRIVSEDVLWADSLTGMWISQCVNSGSVREFSIYINAGSLSVDLGGTNYLVGTVLSIFGTATIQGTLEFDVNMVTGAYTVSLDGVSQQTGTGFVAGVERTADIPLRIGARGADNTTDPAGGFIVQSGIKIGDTQVYIDNVLTRSYDMPTTGTNVTESTNSQDGTLQAGTGGGADWEAGSATPATTVNAGAAVTDGATSVPFTYSDFVSPPTSANLLDDFGGTYALTSFSAVGGTGTVDWQDVQAIIGGSDTLGVALEGDITFQLTNGSETATVDAVYSAKAGYATVNAVAPVDTAVGSWFNGYVGLVATNDQTYYPTASNTTIAADGILTTDLVDSSTLSGVFYDQADNTWKPHAVIINGATPSVPGDATGQGIGIKIGIGI